MWGTLDFADLNEPDLQTVFSKMLQASAKAAADRPSRNFQSNNSLEWHLRCHTFLSRHLSETNSLNASLKAEREQLQSARTEAGLFQLNRLGWIPWDPIRGQQKLCQRFASLQALSLRQELRKARAADVEVRLSGRKRVQTRFVAAI